MIVRLIQECRAFPDRAVGQEFVIDAGQGNHYACLGILKVVKHDPPGDKRSVIKEPEFTDANKMEDSDADEE